MQGSEAQQVGAWSRDRQARQDREDRRYVPIPSVQDPWDMAIDDTMTPQVFTPVARKPVNTHVAETDTPGKHLGNITHRFQ